MIGALASALLLTLAQPPFHVPLLPFLALAPFAVALARTPADRPRDAARAGGVLGAVHFALLLHWVPVALWRHDPATLPLYGVLVGALALLLAGTGWLAHRLRHRTGLPMALALPLAWTAAEWVRADALGPLAFPWLGLGVSLAALPAWAGVAEWVGERGVGFWLAAVGGLVADAWLRATAAASGGRRALRAAGVPAGLALVLAALPVAWGVRRAATLPLRPVGPVVLLQTGVPVGGGADERLAASVAAVRDLTPGVEPGGAGLLVLPEMALPVSPADPRARPFLVAVTELADRAGAPVLFGGPGIVPPEGGTPGGLTNAVLVATGQGLVPIRFDKRALVPGVEATGILGLGWAGAAPAGYRAGVTHGALRVGSTLWGPEVCWEAAFPEIARGLRRVGSDVLVNVSNDGWIAGTGGMAQHPAHLALRAVETRAGVLRAATTGRTLAIDPVGRVQAATVGADPTALRVDAVTSDVVTGFVRWGDVAGPGAALASLLLLLAGEVRERRRRWAREGVPERYRRWWWGVRDDRHGSGGGG